MKNCFHDITSNRCIYVLKIPFNVQKLPTKICL